MVAEFFAPTPTLAKKAAKVVFPKVAGELANQIPVAEVAKAVEEIAKTHRYVKAEYLVETIQAIEPIAEKFITAMDETLRLAITTESKKFDEISTFILMHPDILYKEKYQMYTEIYDKDAKKTNECIKMGIKGALGFTGIVIAGKTATDPKVNKTVQVLIKNTAKTVQNYWKHAEKMVKLQNKW